MAKIRSPQALAEKTVAKYGHLSAKQWRERIPGGLSHGKGPRDFPAALLVRGIVVELEHTNDPLIAMEITMDHLVESLDYYEFLEVAESGMKRRNPLRRRSKIGNAGEGPAEIWWSLTPSQRVTLLEEYGARSEWPTVEEDVAAGIRPRGWTRNAFSSGSARHALGRKGLLKIEGTIVAPTTYSGFHTVREETELGRAVVDWAVANAGGGRSKRRKNPKEHYGMAKPLPRDVYVAVRDTSMPARLEPTQGQIRAEKRGLIERTERGWRRTAEGQAIIDWLASTPSGLQHQKGYEAYLHEFDRLARGEQNPFDVERFYAVYYGDMDIDELNGEEIQAYDAWQENRDQEMLDDSTRMQEWAWKSKANPFADVSSKGRWQVVTHEDLQRHPEILGEVYELLTTAYAPIGGHLKIRSPEDLLVEVDYMDLIDLDDDPYADAALLGKRRKGVKQTAMGHDDSKAAKRELLAHKSRKLKQPGQYAEVSGRIADLMLAGDVPVVTDEATVEQALGKPIRWVGEVPSHPGIEGWYEREIGGHTERKIMIGTPQMNPSRVQQIAARLARGG